MDKKKIIRPIPTQFKTRAERWRQFEPWEKAIVIAYYSGDLRTRTYLGHGVWSPWHEARRDYDPNA